MEASHALSHYCETLIEYEVDGIKDVYNRIGRSGLKLDMQRARLDCRRRAVEHLFLISMSVHCSAHKSPSCITLYAEYQSRSKPVRYYFLFSGPK